MRKRMKKISALILATALMCSALALPEVYAAIGVTEPDKGCSLQVNCNVQIKVEDNADKTDVTLNAYDPIYSEVPSKGITINIYKVAEIQVTGKYKPVAGLSGLDKLTTVDSNTKAKDWQELAVAAKTAVKDAQLKETRSAENVVGTVTFEGLATGLYLIDVQSLITPEYRYEFTPYLISLPNNYYDKTGDDAWDYELVGDDAIGLKPQQFDRYGYLVIQKNLINYDETNPSAVFVFEVTAKKGQDTVFNDVVAIDFTDKGTDYVKVGPIVAGAEVNVAEVYRGASYEQVSVYPEKAQTIVANTYWDECKDYKEAKAKSLETLSVEDVAVTVQNKTFVKFIFTNEHNDVPNGGTGVVNTFTAGESSWSASQEYQGQPGNAQ